MDFTREPIIESVITPREGCKLAVRSSKGVGSEEYLIDALEMVSFGGCFFFRSLERPKSFLVPVTDYEVIEVRETKMVLKSVGSDKKTVKIGGGRTRAAKEPREPRPARAPKEPKAETSSDEEDRSEKKRRRPSRRRRKDEEREQTGSEGATEPRASTDKGDAPVSPELTSLLPPPETLISDTISRYKEDDSFKDAFYDPNSERPAKEPAPQPEIAIEDRPWEKDKPAQEESPDPFGAGDGLEDSGEKTPAKEETPSESPWIIPAAVEAGEDTKDS